MLRVTSGLLLTRARASLERLARRAWRVAGGPPFRVDGDGLPVLADAETWPLEQAGVAAPGPRAFVDAAVDKFVAWRVDFANSWIRPLWACRVGRIGFGLARRGG